MSVETRRLLPNLLTWARIAFIPVLWVLALRGESFALGIVLLVAWSTDVLDGFFARRLRVATPVGSRLDTIGDHLLFVSMLAWVAMLEPGFVREQIVPLAVWFGIWIVALVIGWLRFRRFADLHLYSSKAAVFFAVIFSAHLFLVPGYSPLFFYVAVGVCILAALEMLAVVVVRSEVDEHVGTLLRRRPQ